MLLGLSLALVALGRWQKPWGLIETGHVQPRQGVLPSVPALHLGREAFPQWEETSVGGGFLRGPADVQGTELLSAVPLPQSPEESWCWSRLALPSCMPALWVVGACEQGTRLHLSLVCGAPRCARGDSAHAHWP